METKNVRKGNKALYWLMGLVVVIIAAFVLLRPKSSEAANASSEETGTVTSVNVSETVESSGSLQAQPSATLLWKTGGVVEEVYVEAGDKVKEGDVLMKLQTTTVDASIISAQADLATAQKDLDDLLSSSSTDLAQAVIDLRNAQETYDKAEDYLHYLQTSKKVPQTETRTDTLVRSNSWMYVYKTKVYKGPAPADWIIEADNDLALKKAQLEDAQYTYDRLKDGPNAQDVVAAQAKVDAAQATVDSMSIIAPFDGQVLYIESQPGDLVETGTSAADLANLDHLYIESQVDESDIASVKVDQSITSTLDAMPDLELTGKVVAIDPVGEEDSGLVKYTVLIDIDKVAEDIFLPLGSTANVTIQVKEAATSLAVPINMVQNDSKGEYVLMVQADGSTKRVDVVTGMIADDLVTVTGDLKEGDTVTTSGGN
ncbi:MAG TPA: efflux RND transporter periplasmic adaptor subunit [Anaerolineales bacterium]|nr:efflux RND transporter periplasmic adaptor subunit [Anaerolineales bacterium]